MLEESPSTPYAISFAVLFAYNGSDFDGLERSKGDQSIESILLSTIASIVAKDLPDRTHISIVNISRSSITEKGEHSARQVLSLELGGSPDLTIPNVKSLNDALPKGIHVFDVISIPQGFSARRSCQARTFEFVFPTFVLAPPAQGSMYSNPSLSQDSESEEKFEYPADMIIDVPQGGMFKTHARPNKDSLKVTGQGNIKQVSNQKKTDLPTERKKKKGLGYFLSKFLFGEKVPEKIRKDQEKERAFEKGANLSRETLHKKNAPSITLEVPGKKNELGKLGAQNDNEAFAGMSGFFTTLKRSLSTKRKVFKEDKDIETSEIQYFDPLEIPWDEAYLASLKSYRITESQLKSLKNIVSLYNGTHNWHNYIPGALSDDSRCYLRILNIELSSPEVHEGLEWIRIKIQAKAFARMQIRKMIAFAIMVIRTNTPVSIIGNSFGYRKIELPEVPAKGLIMDEPIYSEYNDFAIRSGNAPIDFESIKDQVESFRKQEIHMRIFAHEAHEMDFARWIHKMDSTSFLYTYFLNERGVIENMNLNALRQ